MTEPRVIRSISAANFALISDEFAKNLHPKDAMIFEIHALRAERDALRKRLDEWVRWGDRMASGHPDAPMASLDHEVRAVIANRYGMSVITAASPALAVQP